MEEAFLLNSINQSINHKFLEWPIYKYLKHYRSTINRSVECQDIWFREQERLESSADRRSPWAYSADVTSDACRQFHTWGSATKNARLSTVERWIRGWMTQSLQPCWQAILGQCWRNIVHNIGTILGTIFSC